MSDLKGFYYDPYVGPSRPEWWFKSLCRVAIPAIAAVLYRPRVEGLEHLPREGGAIVCGNHTSWLDPVFPWYLFKRRVRFMGKVELFDTRFVGWMARSVYAFPVRRGTADREAIKIAVHSLDRGDVVAIFPEGTRVRGVNPKITIHGGPALIAQMAGVSIVPFGIEGASRIMPVGAKFPRFPSIVVRVGEPVNPADFVHLPKGERSDAIMAEVMRRVYALRDGRTY